MPTGKVRYDNLKAAVARVLGFSRSRVETERWTAFRSHWRIESFYCRPGVVGAHEKGGVEGDIGFFRRNHLVPVPDVTSLEELNAMIERWDREDDARRIRGRVRTVGEYFEVERPLLGPLPTEPFETGRLFTVRVDRYSQITVRTNRYSVPVKYIGRRVRGLLHASHLVVYDGAREVSRHERLIAKAGAARNWTTTSKPSPTSPERCPGRPRWSRREPPAPSPRCTTPGGRPPAKPTETTTQPGP